MPIACEHGELPEKCMRCNPRRAAADELHNVPERIARALERIADALDKGVAKS